MTEQLTLVEEAYGLTVIDGESLQLTLDGGNGPSGPAGPAGTNGTNGTNGAAGPNTITTSTTAPSLVGYIFSNGTNVAGATAAASAETPNTLVLRDSGGDASFRTVSVSTLTANGISTDGQVEFNGIDAGDSLTFNMVNYFYGAGAAAAHRTALGAAASSHTHVSANISDATSSATANRVVVRDGSAGASFGALTATALDVASSRVTIGPTGVVNFGATSSLVFDTTTYTYASSGVKSAHRTALGSGATGDALFTAATPAAARTTLGFDAAVPKIPIVFSSGSDFTTTSTTFVNVTGLSFPVLANKNYQISIWLITNKNDANGVAIQLTGPASPTKIFLRNFYSTSTVAANAIDIITAFSAASTTFNTYNGDGLFGCSFGMISNGANAGTIQLQLRAVTGGTAKIYAGSWIQITEL